VQAKVKLLVLVNGPVDCEPAVVLAPLHAPLAVQLVALLDDHVSVLEPPLATLVGLATSVTDGPGIKSTVTELVTMPAAPVQAKV
jgi:hypothetical protein